MPITLLSAGQNVSGTVHNVLKVLITVLSPRLEWSGASKGRMKQAADEELTDSAGLEWSIWHIGESGQLLLSPGCLHRQNPLLASAFSSSTMPCGPRCYVLVEES